MGELALGQNVLVAFMPWQGYNFEDSILVSERIAKDDVFTSIHIEEFECVARDTKLGKEEITRDIPNVGEEALKDLDESRHRAHRRRGEAGRHPRRQDHAEGRDPALPRREAPPRDLRREGRRRPRQLAQGPAGRGRHRHQRPHLLPQGHREGRARHATSRTTERARLERTRDEEIEDPPRLVLPRDQARCSSARPRAASSSTTRARSSSRRAQLIDEATLDEIPRKYWGEIPVDGRRAGRSRCSRDLEELVRVREEHFRDKIDRLSKGDELPPGVIKMVKVYIAIKRKLQVGDKMAGRHGNKGVISPHPAGRGHAVPRRTARRSTSC